MPQVDIYTYFAQLLWFIPCFLLFYILVSKKILSPISEIGKAQRLFIINLEVGIAKTTLTNQNIYLKKHLINKEILNELTNPFIENINANLIKIENNNKQLLSPIVENLECYNLDNEIKKGVLNDNYEIKTGA
jgi:hypothetical protein